MPSETFKPGMAFRSTFVDEDIFLFAFRSTIINGDGLFRRFNRVGGFVEQGWYRFKLNAEHLERAGGMDFRHG
jgi:hypothetical protein